jgi:hypothetical protein
MTVEVMKKVIRRAARQPGAQNSPELRGQAVSQERCTRFMRRHPSLEPTSSPTPCESDNPLLSWAYAKAQAATTSPSARDSSKAAMADRLPEASEQPSKQFDHGNIPDRKAQERDSSNRADRSPEHDIESMTPPNESDAMEIDKDGSRDLKSLVPFRLLPHLSPVEPGRRNPRPVPSSCSGKANSWNVPAIKKRVFPLHHVTGPVPHSTFVASVSWVRRYGR